MPIKINRQEFLRNLESVTPGLSPRDIVEQSSCFVFQGGKVYTYNDEVACQTKSLLPKEMEGAVQATPLLTMLSKYKEETIQLRMTKSRFYIHGKGRETWVTMENKISMGLDNVDKPKNWIELDPLFAEAVGLVQECAGKDEDTFALTCIHIHPRWIEAGDNDQLTRYRLITGVEKSVCIKRDALKHIVPLGMTEMSVSSTWMHFKNPTGLIVSCRRWHEHYPDWSPYFKVKGTKTTLPKGLVEACDKAGVFSQENENDWMKLIISKGRLSLESEGVSGGHRERKKLAYDGPKMSFFIGPKLLSEIVKKHNECIMSDRALLVDGGKWKFVASLELPNKKEEKDEDEDEPD
jgi:hypothetical protein